MSAVQKIEPTDTEPCANCAASGYESSALTNWDGVTCRDCNGTGRVEIDVPVYGNPGDAQQIEIDCRCQPPAPTDDDFLATYAVDYGKGYIDWAELARREREMNRERAVALSDLGEPDYTLPAHLLG